MSEHTRNTIENPLVSVCIPTRNRNNLLKRAIASVLKQTYRNFEIIIVDDASTDNTPNFLLKLKNTTPQTTIIHCKEPAGAARSRNLAIQAAKGYFITFLDDDDQFTPERLQNLVENWQQSDRKIIAICGLKAEEENQETVENQNRITETITREDLFLRNHVGIQFLLKTDTIRKLGGFDESLDTWEDLDFALTLTKHGVIRNTQKANYVLDRSHSTKRVSNQDISIISENCEKIIKKQDANKKQRNRIKAQTLVYKFSKETALLCSFYALLLIDIPLLKAIFMRFYRSQFGKQKF